MTAEQMQAWIDAGQEIGSHTLTHCDLTTLDLAGQRREVAASREKLNRLVRQPGGVRNFCYPYGALNQQSVVCVQESGYETATTTVRGRVSVADRMHLLTLPRILVSRTTTCAHLLLKCLTAYEDRRRVDLAWRSAE
jgi:peptidoglycan/xylan/chitin deacetylase (PgdA/CDA1 family)